MKKLIIQAEFDATTIAQIKAIVDILVNKSIVIKAMWTEE